MGFLAIISPAKTIDFSDNRADHFTQPRLLTKTRALVRVLKKKKAPDLMALMNISEKLGDLNQQRYKQFKTPFTEENAKQAVLAFKGDVYLGLEAENLSEEELLYAQDHLRILSGLYGLLRPLDLMQPYRLEMGTKLKTDQGKNLYEFWGDKLTKLLNKDIKEGGHSHLINLASKEYFSALQVPKIKVPVANIHFKENRNGVFKVISFNAKKARGAMAKAIIKENISDIESLKTVNIDGYQYNETLSEGLDLIYTK